MRRFLLSLCAITTVALPLAVAQSASSEELRIRIPVDYNLDNPPGTALKEFKRIVEDRSQGEITVEIFADGSLYRGADAVQAVLRGDVEISAVVSPHWIGISPQLSVFELPFAFPTRESIYNTIENAHFMDMAFDEVDEKGGHLVDIFVYDYALLANSTRPLITLQDFDGIKLRAIGRTNGQFLELLGGSTVPVNITEVSLAIDRGIIEGMSTAPDFWVQYKWSESVNFATDANFQIFYYPYIANKNWWDNLSAEQRDHIQVAMNEAFTHMREVVVEERAKSMAALASQGIEIHSLSSEEIEDWKEATNVIWTEAEHNYGEDLVEALRNAASVNE